ncbi:hypothetical protein HJ143_13530 [Vibrio parahaemolyticus]|nr:hypothetical protein [Vibrio parahaemolyticus]
MKEILIVTTVDGYFAQGEMPWSSMNVETVKSELEKKGFVVNVVTFDYLKGNNVKDKIIVYTSSQRIEHKKYIEDVMYFLKDENIIIPSYTSLKAHDNKGFQCLLNNKYNLGLIESDYLCDIKELDYNSVKFPLVAKPANGASSIGVDIVKDEKQVELFYRKLKEFDYSSFKNVLKKYIFRNRYNKKWDDYASFAKGRFVIQKFIPQLKYDYKVLIFGEKYYVLKRSVAKGDFRASGSGIHSTEFDKEVFIVLDAAKTFKNKYRSHIYSLDICVSEGRARFIEFQFTHVGPVTLTHSNFFFVSEGGGMEKSRRK